MSEELDAHGYLRAVYRGRIIAETARMKAAIAALPFEKPKLEVTVSATGNFAAMMEQIAQASGRSNVIDAKSNRHRLPAKVIETDPVEGR